MKVVAALPAVFLPFAPYAKAWRYLTSVISVCLKFQRGCTVYGWTWAPKETEAASVDFLWWTCKREGSGQESASLHLSVIFFLKIHSSFFVVKCRGKLDGLAKQRWMFSLKQSADGAHSRGKLCKSLH